MLEHKIDAAVLIGCGGTGSQLADPLFRMLRYHFGVEDDATFFIADGDTFEEKNMSRQQCGDRDVGENKALVMARQLASRGLQVKPIEAYLSKMVLMELLAKAQFPLVIATVDNKATRNMAIQTLAKRPSFIYLSPGNNDDSDGQGRIDVDLMWWARLCETEWGMDPRIADDGIANPQDTIPQAGSCSEQAPSAPQLISANALAASWTLAILQNLLDGRLPGGASQLHVNGRSAVVQVA